MATSSKGQALTFETINFHWHRCIHFQFPKKQHIWWNCGNEISPIYQSLVGGNLWRQFVVYCLSDCKVITDNSRTQFPRRGKHLRKAWNQLFIWATHWRSNRVEKEGNQALLAWVCAYWILCDTSMRVSGYWKVDIRYRIRYRRSDIRATRPQIHSKMKCTMCFDALINLAHNHQIW